MSAQLCVVRFSACACAPYPPSLTHTRVHVPPPHTHTMCPIAYVSLSPPSQFYTVKDHLDRPYKVLRHNINAAAGSSDDVVYEESDEVGVGGGGVELVGRVLGECGGERAALICRNVSVCGVCEVTPCSMWEV